MDWQRKVASGVSGFQRTEGRQFRSTIKGQEANNLQKPGSVSFHLFIDESSSATTRDSHSAPMKPISILDFIVAYKVLRAKPSISESLINHMKQVILHGLPGGC